MSRIWRFDPVQKAEQWKVRIQKEHAVSQSGIFDNIEIENMSLPIGDSAFPMKYTRQTPPPTRQQKNLKAALKGHPDLLTNQISPSLASTPISTERRTPVRREPKPEPKIATPPNLKLPLNLGKLPQANKYNPFDNLSPCTDSVASVADVVTPAENLSGRRNGLSDDPYGLRQLLNVKASTPNQELRPAGVPPLAGGNRVMSARTKARSDLSNLSGKPRGASRIMNGVPGLPPKAASTPHARPGSAVGTLGPLNSGRLSNKSGNKPAANFGPRPGTAGGLSQTQSQASKARSGNMSARSGRTGSSTARSSMTSVSRSTSIRDAEALERLAKLEENFNSVLSERERTSREMEKMIVEEKRKREEAEKELRKLKNGANAPVPKPIIHRVGTDRLPAPLGDFPKKKDSSLTTALFLSRPLAIK
eukprot:GFYU01008787.1.p1 GENE.GFYU01008787.1~~GFYU01008787.1.p1  ORF type:complete len:420 (-),score=77.93 GFYU01008787.1:274-1533(-)